jgi:hypothetical protein
MYQKKKVYLLFLVILLNYQLLPAQNLKSDLKSVMEIARYNRAASSEILNIYIEKEPENLVKAVFPYLNDSSPDVRVFAINLFGKVGKAVSTKVVRQEIVVNLVNACGDINRGVRNEAIIKLKHFKKEDFNEQSKNKILELVSNRELLDKTFIRIAGMANPEGISKVLNELLADSTIKKRDLKWNIQLALARTGNKAASEYCVNFVSSVGVNEMVAYELFPDLVYTRSYESMEYLVKILNSDEKNCRSSNPDSNEKITCAYRVMEYLAPVIEYYPVETNASGDIKTSDYKRALITVREWFAKQNGRYIINSSTF